MIDTIITGRIIDGISSTAIEDGLLAIEGERIAYAGPAEGFKSRECARMIEAETILPGFFDVHAHLSGEADAGEYAGGKLLGDQLLGAAYQVGLLLDSGFTGIRDMSETGLYLARAQQRGILRSPRIMPGGRCLSILGGHGDFDLSMSKEEYNRQNTVCVLCDGEEECVQAVREQFRKGAKFIKVLATGGVSSPGDDLNDVQFSPSELKAIVEEARRRHSYVAAHCTGSEGAYQALMAGVECIEHGVMLTQREIDLMAERNIPLVSTLAVSLGCARIPDMPDWFTKKARQCAQANIRTIAMARKAGVRIALGTDFSNSKTSPYLKNGREFEAMVEAGMTPMEAIQAGTINGAYVMRCDRETGSLEAGKLADVVLCDGNPLEDIRCIGDAEHIRHVFLGGKLVK